eukprot:TRINITY_DN16750_c2_g1_i1.p1 TRINITY_DN16750_c2_g1~~TRINITY_DN16750_c2_g1_i1.p1  ORF type:complete len:816 (+),score=71.09 TRINITY_DN16750_c2_g1_i1:69-2516(+)
MAIEMICFLVVCCWSISAALPPSGFVAVAVARHRAEYEIHELWQKSLVRRRREEHDVIKPEEYALHTLAGSYGYPSLCLQYHPDLNGSLAFATCDATGFDVRIIFDFTDGHGLLIKTEDGKCLGVDESLLDLAASSTDSIQIAARVEVQVCTGLPWQRFVFLPAADRGFSAPSAKQDASVGSFCLEADDRFCWNHLSLSAFPDMPYHKYHKSVHGLVLSNHALRFELQVHPEPFTYFLRTPAAFWTRVVVCSISVCAMVFGLLVCAYEHLHLCSSVAGGLGKKRASLGAGCTRLLQLFSALGRMYRDAISQLPAPVQNIIDERRLMLAKTMSVMILPSCILNLSRIGFYGLFSLPQRGSLREMSWDFLTNPESVLSTLVTPFSFAIVLAKPGANLEGRFLDFVNIILTVLAVLLYAVPVDDAGQLMVSRFILPLRFVQCIVFSNTRLNVCLQTALTIAVFIYHSMTMPISHKDSSLFHSISIVLVVEFLFPFVASWPLDRERMVAACALVQEKASKFHVQVLETMMLRYCDATVRLDSELRVIDGGSRLNAMLLKSSANSDRVDFMQLLLESSQTRFEELVEHAKAGKNENVARIHVDLRGACNSVVQVRLDACAWHDTSDELQYLLGITEDCHKEPPTVGPIPEMVLQTRLFPISGSRSCMSSSSSSSLTSNGSSSEVKPMPVIKRSYIEIRLNYTLRGDVLEASPSLKRYFGVRASRSLRHLWENQNDFEEFQEWHKAAVSSMKSSPQNCSKLALTAPKALLRSPGGILYDAEFSVSFSDAVGYELSSMVWEFSATIMCRRRDETVGFAGVRL